MNKIKILLSVTAVFPVFTTFGGSYQTMQFNTVDGERHYLPLENLEIVYENNVMVATQGANHLEIPLTELASMQFSDEEASVGLLHIDSKNPVEVFTLNGIFKGIFYSADDLNARIPAGIYVARDKNGTSLKIAIRK